MDEQTEQTQGKSKAPIEDSMHKSAMEFNFANCDRDRGLALGEVYLKAKAYLSHIFATDPQRLVPGRDVVPLAELHFAIKAVDEDLFKKGEL